MKSKVMFGLVTVSALAFFLIIAGPVSAASDEAAVLQVAENWAKAYSTMDYKLFASLYRQSPETTAFEPGKAGAFLLKGWDAIDSNFKPSYQYPAGAMQITLHNPNVTVINENAAVTTGYHIAIWTDPSTEEQSVYQVRQTLVVEKVKGEWLIVPSHASMFPIE